MAAMNAYFQEQADRPFGNVELMSGRALAPFSSAGLTAADNVMAKADRALAGGDLERAGHFIDRAAALNYDEHEKTAPAAFAASMMLFRAVTDALQRSREGDSRWLEAAVQALSSAGGWGQSEMRHLLLVVCQDYGVEPGERRTIEDAVFEVPERADLCDVMLSPAELAEAVTSVLQILQTYRAALNAG
ncbi:MAG: hypothetical protein ACRDOY_03295 [Nocardioidaceae bacterium]